MLRRFFSRRRMWFAALMASIGITFSAACRLVNAEQAGSDASKTTVTPSEYRPIVAAASDEGQRAIGTFQVPAGMKVELIAAEPDVANPVAFCFDERGRIFVAETFRQQRGVEDNRNHMNWLDDDLAAQTVDDRLAMFKKFLTRGCLTIYRAARSYSLADR